MALLGGCGTAANRCKAPGGAVAAFLFSLGLGMGVTPPLSCRGLRVLVLYLYGEITVAGLVARGVRSSFTASVRSPSVTSNAATLLPTWPGSDDVFGGSS